MNDQDPKICPRCGNEFIPQPTNLKVIPYTKFCPDCRLRNLFDGLDIPTPPELLDKHTINPTLSNKEYQKKLNQIPQEE